MFLRAITITLLLASLSFAETLSLALPDSLERLVEKATGETMALNYKAEHNVKRPITGTTLYI